ATVEATCYRGLLDALAGKSPGGRGMLEKGVHQARTMGRLSLEAQCRVHLARIDVGEGRYEEAIAALDGIPSESDRSIGGELEAAVHYWRGRALLGRHNVSGAAPELAL